MLIGEIYLPVDRLMHYYGRERAEVHLPFNFQLIDAPWNARALATLIADYEAALPPGGWPNWVLGNHDRPRIAAKRGQAQARVAAMLLLTLRGTPTLYYGDELGLGDVEIPPAQVQDPRELREPGLGLGRDPVRTPMPWDASRTPASPRPSRGCRSMPTGRCATSRGWRRSLIRCWRSIADCWLPARASGAGDRRHRAAGCGGRVLAYERRHGAERLLVALNLGGRPQRLALPAWASDAGCSCPLSPTQRWPETAPCCSGRTRA